MTTEILQELYDRDLQNLRKEISSYSNELDLWRTEKHISNSAGNLCLHLIGNLNHFIGNVLGNSGYIRDREAEFSSKNIPLSEMLASIEATRIVVKKTLSELKTEDLMKDFPLEVMGKKSSTLFWLINFAGHLTYHLGQINYHRRLLKE
ncbi:MAG TPA: DUF1572 family protein [Bacteroidia bacterium]|nr:DUF1572 family protein [Bacteroidia bacterium]HRH07765.1 DUF1572 family protein [Bacteroidia bacterium]